ncbi:MAG: TlyA family RNA methyltransferase [Synergistaceae bacterium]|jgi:23S rRNA (cytidine1920-2'-O)/16S rRNA (cytidine1409-2'-O)-methyltransferase|nr:TlyA family RNA methyltransferase [Synergistaceae bacterium]
MAGTLRRLDKILVERGFAASRDAAREMISRGAVSVAGLERRKSASMFPGDVSINVKKGGGFKWVSRGALKLIKALDEWSINPAGLMCVDIGASTGGFTQVLLSRGASAVAAVDVGYGQLAWELRRDSRVSLLERTNARYLKKDDIGRYADIITVDASFISLRTLLPNLFSLLDDDGKMIALVKPQFEVGRGRTRKGVVRDPALHAEVLRGLAGFVREDGRMSLRGAAFSPIRGAEGNIEFMFYLGRTLESGDRRAEPGGDDRARGPFAGDFPPIDFERIVREAHDLGRTDA